MADTVDLYFYYTTNLLMTIQYNSMTLTVFCGKHCASSPITHSVEIHRAATDHSFCFIDIFLCDSLIN